MLNIIKLANGYSSKKEIYALVYANILIHKDDKTNIAQMDMITKKACEMIKSKLITKVLMNPPDENKYRCKQTQIVHLFYRIKNLKKLYNKLSISSKNID